MIEIDDAVPVEQPDEETILRTVFGMSETELAICRRLMARREVTVEELASAVDRDRSVVTRHLNHLVELGMVDRQSRVLSEGGRVHVFTHRSPDAVRKRFRLGLFTWIADAVDVIEQFSEDKIEGTVRQDDEAKTFHDQAVVDRDDAA